MGEFSINFLVGVQTQNPVAAGLIDRRIFLRGVALPLLEKYFRAQGFGHFDGAVGGAGVQHDDLATGLLDQFGDADQRARQVVFFVVRDEDDGEGLRHGRPTYHRGTETQRI